MNRRDSRTHITVRTMRPDEGQTFLDIHRRSIWGLASGVYPPEVISAWIVPRTAENLRRFLENRDEEIRLIAELNAIPVGIGAIVLRGSELRACYVAPEAARKGVGTAIVKELERIACENGLTSLELKASINAEPFYTAMGYIAISHGDHVLRSGQRMAAVTMRKVFS